MNNWMQQLAQFIKKERKKRGLSQEDLARMTTMNTSYISRLESGQNFQSVKLDFFIRLVKVFEMDREQVLSNIGIIED